MNSIPSEQLSNFKQIALWLRLLLSSIFLAALIATLLCAFIGATNVMIIASCLLIGAIHGVYNAESIRTGIGFYQYNQTMKHLDNEG